MDNISASDPSSSSPPRKRINVVYRDWAGLPGNILLSIMDYLTVPDDYVRFGAVCTSWHTLFAEEISSRRPACCTLPFLLIAPPCSDKAGESDIQDYFQRRAFYSLSRGRVYDFHLRLPHNEVCRGSSFGWLITEKAKARRYDYKIQLQNPFLNRIIDLPPLDSILKQHPDRCGGMIGGHYDYEAGWTGYYVRKAVLSSDPCSSPDDFVVMAIMSRYQGLAYFKPGNTTWTSIGDDWHTDSQQGTNFCDVIFFHKTKQFYAMLRDGAILSIEFTRDQVDPKLNLIAPYPMYNNGLMKNYLAYYLVEDFSSGDLFQVFKYIHTCNISDVVWLMEMTNYGLEQNYGFNSSQTTPVSVHFAVFKVDASNGTWTQIDDLGDNIIFVGSNGSVLRPTLNCPGYEPNCIYFTDDDDVLYRSNFEYYGLPSDGIYNLKDDTSRMHYSAQRPDIIQPRPRFRSSRTEKILPQAIWLEPTLRRCN